MLIIGSVAMRHHFTDARAPVDIDVIVDGSSLKKKVGGLLVETFWDEPMRLIKDESGNDTFISASNLLTLKMSHAGWDVNWRKTMFDIAFLQRRGCVVSVPLYEKLVKMWSVIHGKKQVNTNMTDREFFSDAVVRKYDHDWLHEQTAIGPVPAYLSIQVKHGSPHCDKNKWEETPDDVRFNCVIEETLVTAIERFNLDLTSTKSQKLIAISVAFKKLCTTMSSGWFSMYCIQNGIRMSTESPRILAHLNSTLGKL
jgi:hypothetical protein